MQHYLVFGSPVCHGGIGDPVNLPFLFLFAVVVMVIVAILVYRYRRRAHKSGSWSPPRSTADSPTDSIKYTSAVIATSVGDSKRTI